MKILIVNTNDIDGGAARAAYRLHLALQRIGIKSTMLVQRKSSDDHTVLGPETKYQRIAAKVRPHLDSIPKRAYKKRSKTLFSPAWAPFSDVVKRINSLNPDIVHLHWVAGGMLKIEDLAKINSPIVWSLHDIWPFSGGCHVDSNCDKYKSECGSCPILNSKEKHDLSYHIFKRKKKAFSKISNLTIIGLSRWMANCAKDSVVFNNRRVINLPNPIDTNYFKPLNKKVAREIINLPTQKKMILFGAMGAVTDPNKGFDIFSAALKQVELNNVELVIFGATQPSGLSNNNYPVHFLGRLHDDISLRVLYSAANVVVVPSLQENLSNVIMESIACGVPVVAFDIGGNPDMIDHKQNGYLAKPYESSDLAEGMKWVINHPEPELLADKARQKVLDCFEMEAVAKRYKKLYEEILYNFKS